MSIESPLYLQLYKVLFINIFYVHSKYRDLSMEGGGGGEC
jgi:hypothetical protein